MNASEAHYSRAPPREPEETPENGQGNPATERGSAWPIEAADCTLNRLGQRRLLRNPKRTTFRFRPLIVIALEHSSTSCTLRPRNALIDSRLQQILWEFEESEEINRSFKMADKTFTYSDVSEHTAKKDLYMVIHDKVYNATSFVDEHPYVPPPSPVLRASAQVNRSAPRPARP